MSPSLTVATIQMDGAPAPTDSRLARASNLVRQAATKGADLVVLPAAFNTGKTFLETNYEVTERLNDQTLNWLIEQASEYSIHLVSSFMIVDKDDTYNAAFLVAPDGKIWRYEQNYPHLWERVFYRDGHQITVADTELGKIGLMISWDAAHPDVWERYAAKVDLLLIMNDALNYEQATLHYPDGQVVTVNQFGFFARWLAKASCNYLHYDIEAQGNWLRVPTICVGASGEFKSILPAPFFSVGTLLLGNAEAWSEADKHYADMQFVAPFQRNTRLLDHFGNTVARITDEGDTVLVHQLDIPEQTPLPIDAPQPEMSVSEIARFIIDGISSAVLSLNYRRGVRRQWGANMAKMDAKTRVWLIFLAIVAFTAALISQLFLPKKS